VTSIIGIYCKDGVVIGADSATTFGNGRIPTIEQPSEKIEVIADKILVAGTGEVGLNQRFCNQIKIAYESKLFKDSEIECCRNISRNALIDFEQTGIKIPNINYGALVAFPIHDKHYLCEFGINTIQPELKTKKIWYVSMGCTQGITDPFLAFIREIFWENELPNINEAIFAIYWTIDHAIKVNPGGVNGPISIAILEKSNGSFSPRKLTDEDLFEHIQNIEDAKKALKDYKTFQQSKTAVIPKVPQR